MTGFIRGLFGSKSKKVGDENAEAKKDSREFFLDADSSKTYGDIDYMRTAKAVRKSYPKTLSNNDLEGIEVISSMEKLSSDRAVFNPEVIKSETFSQPEPKQQTSKANNDTNMDMFRKMAKDIKK